MLSWRFFNTILASSEPLASESSIFNEDSSAIRAIKTPSEVFYFATIYTEGRPDDTFR